MNRWLLIVALGSCVGPLGCSSDDDEHERRHSSTHGAVNCSSKPTCGTCTPVLGCGWCSFGDGTGKCASGPSACGSAFRWNWETVDCPVGAPADAGDAGDAAVEASTETGSDTGTTSETTAETASDTPAPVCNAPTTFAAGCARTMGGTLCAPTQYTLGCHSGTPEASLACKAAATSGTSTYYCCPCP